jgi:excisionase family DNA binding protein
MPEMLTVAEAARRAGVSRSYMHRMLRDGRVGTITTPLGRYRFRRYVSGQSLAHFIAQRTTLRSSVERLIV